MMNLESDKLDNSLSIFDMAQLLYYGSISEGYYKLEIVLTQNGKNYSLSDIFFISN